MWSQQIKDLIKTRAKIENGKIMSWVFKKINFYKPLPIIRKKREDSKEQNFKWIRRHHNLNHRNAQYPKRLLWKITCEQTGQPKRNGKTNRNMQYFNNQEEIENDNRPITGKEI